LLQSIEDLFTGTILPRFSRALFSCAEVDPQPRLGVDPGDPPDVVIGNEIGRHVDVWIFAG
jgi:hypothetical protein